MPKKTYTTEQIIVKLREIEVLCGQGKTIAEAVRMAEISEQTYYRWRKAYGGMNVAEAKRLGDADIFLDEETNPRPFLNSIGLKAPSDI